MPTSADCRPLVYSVHHASSHTARVLSDPYSRHNSTPSRRCSSPNPLHDISHLGQTPAAKDSAQFLGRFNQRRPAVRTTVALVSPSPSPISSERRARNRRHPSSTCLRNGRHGHGGCGRPRWTAKKRNMSSTATCVTICHPNFFSRNLCLDHVHPVSRSKNC